MSNFILISELDDIVEKINQEALISPQICLVRGKSTPIYYQKFTGLQKFNIVKEIIHHGNPVHYFNKDKIHCDILLAIGGGSVIDSAKLMLYHGEIVFNNKQNFIVIPTTCGSGSESTSFAVEYIGNNKFSRKAKKLLPSTVIQDPSAVSSKINPSFIDAVCQSIESYFSVKSTRKSRKTSEAAFKLLVKSVDFDSMIISNRQNAILGSSMSGKAINVAKTNAAHAFSYYLTLKHNVPHGLAVLSSEIFFVKNVLKNFNKKDAFLLESLPILEKLKSIIDWSLYCPAISVNYISAVNKERIMNYPFKFSNEKLINHVKGTFGII
jgi:alcohol dehydrogenase YqhD (iron-dependent ADH family)